MAAMEAISDPPERMMLVILRVLSSVVDWRALISLGWT